MYLKTFRMKDFWFLKKLAWNLRFYSGGNIGHAEAWLSQIPQKRFHYLKYIFEHWKLTRINYIEIVCHIYPRVLFLCGLWGESLISILMGAFCGFDDPQTMLIWNFEKSTVKKMVFWCKQKCRNQWLWIYEKNSGQWGIWTHIVTSMTITTAVLYHYC